MSCQHETMRALCTILIAALWLPQARAAGGLVAVRAGTVLTMAGPPLHDAWIVIRDGKIVQVGTKVHVPEDVTVIDATGKVVMPGLIASRTSLAENERPSEWTMSPEIRAVDSFDSSADYRQLLAGGVTSAYLATSVRRLVSGQGAVVKLGGEAGPGRVLKGLAALQVNLGEWAKNPPGILTPPLPPGPDNPVVPAEKQRPTSRLSQLAMLKALFAESRRAASEARSVRESALAPYLAGTLPVRLNCQTKGDLANALRLAKELEVRAVLEAATDAHELVERIAAAGLPVVLGADFRPGLARPGDDLTDTALGTRDPRTAALLTAKGVKVSLYAPTTESTGELLAIAAAAVGYGMAPERALGAVTVDAAEILGVADRVGTLEPGKDADFVILSGDPLATKTVVEKTFVDGTLAYDAEKPAGLDGDCTVLRAKEVWTGTGQRIANGVIVCRDGLIESVGPAESPLPKGAKVVEFPTGVLAPGLIDIHSHLGLHWEAEPPRAAPGEATRGPAEVLRRVSPALAVTPDDPGFAAALRGGVTTVLLSPNTTGLFCGNVAAVKLGGDPASGRWLLAERAACKFSLLGGIGRDRRAGEAADLLGKARSYFSDRQRYERELADYRQHKLTDREDELDKPTPPKRDPELESLAELFVQRLPALVRADRPDEIRAAVRVFHEDFGLALIILGGQESYRALDDLHGTAVAVGPNVLTDEKGRAVNNADLLARAGVPVAFQSDATTGARDLRLAAALAVRHGMDETAAFRALTEWPAHLAKLDHRVGLLAPGRDADVVVYSGSPLEFTSSVRKVMIDGKWVYEAP